MNKKGQVPLKNLAYAGGGALLGYLIFKNVEAAIIGGIIGLIISFRW